jgi:hypothetical protein
MKLVLLAVLWAAASAQDQQPQRFFGSFPLMVDPTVPISRQPFHFEAHHIANDSNLAAFHMEFFGVPWREFAAGQNPPEAWLREMDSIRGLQERFGLPMYLALTPIGGSRDKLASNAVGTYALSGDDSFGSTCEPIDARPDYESVIRPGYRAYVSYMIRRFQPRFVALSIEVDLYAFKCPAAWNAMKRLLNETYDMVKSEHPGLPVFHTFQIDVLWQADRGDPCFGFRRDCLAQNIQSLADLNTDIFAISTYPSFIFAHNGGQLPDDYVTVFAGLTGKPLAIAETGYQAVPFAGHDGDACVLGVPSSVDVQAWWMAHVLRDADLVSMPFVVWWANEDLMPAPVAAPCDCADDSVWCQFLQALDAPARDTLRGDATMGMRAFDGTPRPAYELWVYAVKAASSVR